MYRSHVRYARIYLDSRRKKTLDASCNLSPMGSKCSLPFTGRHPDSSSRHGRFKEHQSPHPSSSPVGCYPWRLTEKTIGPHVPRKPCPKPSFGLWRGLRHPPCPEILLLFRGLPLCQRRSSARISRVTCNIGSRTIASRGTGFESPFFPLTVATCPAPRLMAAAIAEGTPCPPQQVDRSSRASHEVRPGRSYLT